MTDADLATLRGLALAARKQLAEGPREWPGTPSRQRLELFLAVGPEQVIYLLDEIAQLRERHS
jgi:hypothetical protein